MELNKINHGNKISLLIGGKQAFPVILQEIRNCRESIYICMFVWREDLIGKQIARELLLAADRGVKIVIDKDRYGILCECSEENRNSLFHKDPVFKDIVGINIFKILYDIFIYLHSFFFRNTIEFWNANTRTNIWINNI